MPRGGARPGAGRPRKQSWERVQEAAKAPQPPGRWMQPLDWMLTILNDPAAPPDRRDRMAIAAAPYCHAKIAEQGKKQADDEASRTAAKGTPWEALLNRPTHAAPLQPESPWHALLTPRWPRPDDPRWGDIEDGDDTC
jgi:phage terminase small subunit